VILRALRENAIVDRLGRRLHRLPLFALLCLIA
jgi:hypothetical protein